MEEKIEGLPKVSILLPIKGAAPFLKETLSSVLSQTGVPFELIVVLDQPKASVELALEDYARLHSNIRLIRNSGAGISAALNHGLANSKSEIIARIDDDDLMLPDRLLRQFQFLVENPSIDCCGTQVNFIDSESRVLKTSTYPISPRAISHQLEYANAFAHSSVMFRKKSVVRIGGYDSVYDGIEDYDLWLRLNNGKNMTNLRNVYSCHRIHKNQSTFGNESKSLISASLRRIEPRGFAVRNNDSFSSNNLIDYEFFLQSLILSSTSKNFLKKEYVNLLFSKIARDGTTSNYFSILNLLYLYKTFRVNPKRALLLLVRILFKRIRYAPSRWVFQGPKF